MKFRGELKFPEIDHPGVPIHVVIEGSQTELVIEGESLGRWSLYDVHARRLVANAFSIELDGTEVTFVADDPIDFAYRGVEHMAETWATLKSKRMAGRTIAVRKSRKGTIPSRIDDMKAAMVANLEAESVPRHLAGEVALPEPVASDTGEARVDDALRDDWDRRDEAAAIPVMSEESIAAAAAHAALSEETRLLEEEKQRIAEERARLEQERRVAEQREADRIEAFRLEMQRLEAEREAMRRQAAETAEKDAAAAAEVEEEAEKPAEPKPFPDSWRAAGSEFVPVVAQPEPEPVDEEPEVEPEPVDEEPVDEEPEVEPEPVEAEREFEPVAVSEPGPDPSVEEPEPAEETQTAAVLDLKHLEADRGRVPSLDSDAPGPSAPIARTVEQAPPPQPQPAMAGAVKDKTGLMGAVRAAFRSGPRDHDHQFIEAPGGIGITRYVCEECGYVSISV